MTPLSERRTNLTDTCPPAADYLAHDVSAASVLFAVSTGMTLGDGLLIRDKTLSQYDGDPQAGLALPLTATQSSQINPEFVYHGQRKLELAGWHVGREQILTTS